MFLWFLFTFNVTHIELLQVDLLIVSPYVFTVVQFANIPASIDSYQRLFSFFRTMRLLRLVSIVKFSRYFRRIQMIFAILRATWTELVMLCYFMVINSVIFGTIIYLVELDGRAFNDGDFNSIPRAMYWAFITMLTIGKTTLLVAPDFDPIWFMACSYTIKYDYDLKWRSDGTFLSK